MFCENCGNKVNEGAKFCSKCGNQIGIIKNQTISNEETINKNKTSKKIVCITLTIVAAVVIIGIIVGIAINSNRNIEKDIILDDEMDTGNIDKTDINNSENSIEVKKAKIDIEKFITELSYSSISTVHNKAYGGDGYRNDYGFYTSELTKNDFEIKNEENKIIYTLNTNGSGSDSYPFTLEIITTNDSILEEIKISCRPTSLEIGGIMNCALEVEEALGYTLYNSRNYGVITEVRKQLSEQNIIDNRNVLVTNTKIMIDNLSYGQDVIFEITEDTLSFCMVNISEEQFKAVQNEEIDEEEVKSQAEKSQIKKTIDAYADITTKHDGYTLTYIGYTQYARSKNRENVYKISYTTSVNGVSVGLWYERLVSLDSTNTRIAKKSDLCKSTGTGYQALLDIAYKQLWGN